MFNLDHTYLDSIRHYLKLCVAEIDEICKGWASVGIYYDIRRGDLIEDKSVYSDNFLSKIIDKSLLVYKTSKISEYLDALEDHYSDNKLKNEILKNLTLFVRDRQETYYHAQLRDFLHEVHVIIDELNLITKGSDIFYSRKEATKYSLLSNLILIEFDRVEMAIVSIKYTLQPFLLPFYDNDWKIAIEGKGSSDFFSSKRVNKIESKLNNEESSQIEPCLKLQWNGTNDSLYDLIAQLSLITVTTAKPLLGNTIEGLATFLANHVEGMPSVQTIERRLRAFREPQGQRPKRNCIELNINKESQ